MPATDSCEPQIIRALEKQGWLILRKHYPIRIGQSRRAVFADLQLQRRSRGNINRILVVEIKCFTSLKLQLDECYHAIGQYQIYRNALNLKEVPEPIYLAIPSNIYQSVFQEKAIRMTIEDARIKLIVVNLHQEEIEAWID